MRRLSKLPSLYLLGCWGFAVEVITNETAYTLYSDFKTEKVNPDLFDRKNIRRNTHVNVTKHMSYINV